MAGGGLITSRRTFVTGPRCSKGSWKILNHREKLGFDGPRGGNQRYYRAGDAICNNRQKHGDEKIKIYIYKRLVERCAVVTPAFRGG